MGSASNERKALHVVVVGAGFAGIATAVECLERGLNVTIIERYLKTNEYGGLYLLIPGQC